MYILEGNIGAGKSTFLKMLKKELSYLTIGLEPKNNWYEEIGGNSLLSQFYQKPKRWAYTLETLTLFSRVNQHKTEQEQKNPFHVIERSIYSGNYCFAKNCYENGFLTEIEWKTYQKWFSFVATDICQLPHGFIYLRVDPTKCHERAKLRNRSSEKLMTIGYLKQIHQHHENFLIEKNDILADLFTVPVLILDAHADFEHNKTVFEKQCAAVEDFIIHTQAQMVREDGPYISPRLE